MKYVQRTFWKGMFMCAASVLVCACLMSCTWTQCTS